jgi:dTDP-4-dehydrorhamnose 3,5-epimerase-like enzyme
MKIIQSPLEGAFEIIPNIYEDERGYFFESFNRQKFKEATGIDINFVQDNESFPNMVSSVDYITRKSLMHRLSWCV